MHFSSIAKTIHIKKQPSNISIPAFCKRYNLLRSDVTRMTQYSPRAVAKWIAGDKPSAAAQKQLKELIRLFHALSEIMETNYIGEWLKSANPAFDHSTPLQVIERGEADRIWHMIYSLQSGEPL